MEATLFTGWIYDFLKDHAEELKVAHPAMLDAITNIPDNNKKMPTGHDRTTNTPLTAASFRI